MKQLVIKAAPGPLVWALRVPYRLMVGRAPFAAPTIGAPSGSDAELADHEGNTRR